MYLNIKKYFRPVSADEAYEILVNSNGTVIGGGAFLQTSNIEIEAGVDLTNLNLDFIQERDGSIEIGAMTTLRKVETSDLLLRSFDGVLNKSAAVIMGVQIRNTATIGGSVCGKYGFSDILPSLLALDACLELYKGGRMTLENFLDSYDKKDILLKIVLKKDGRKASFLSLRNTANSFAILNTAVSKDGGKFRICVGARPFKAKCSHEAENFINAVEVNEENAVRAGEIASDSLQFGSDIRGSSEYRKELCKVLVKRSIMEVAK